MTADAIFSPRLFAGWAAAAAIIFGLSIYLMGQGEVNAPETVGPNTYSRSAIGHAGIADVLQQLGLPVIKSRYNSLAKLSPGSVLVIAEPRLAGQSEEATRDLLKAANILLVLPKWTGEPSEQFPGWLREVHERAADQALAVLRLAAPRATLSRESGTPQWTTNALGLAPSLVSPVQLVRGDRLRPIIASERGILLAEIAERGRRIWILADPDVIANHGLVRENNAALAVAIVKRLRGDSGSVVFDETVHGFAAPVGNPLQLLFRFPFVVATAQALMAAALLLWATWARFGAPQVIPPALGAGRQALLVNMATLIDVTGHHQVMIRRYIQETVRDTARQLHAPKGLIAGALVTWLQRVGNARGVDVDCGEVVRRAAVLDDTRGNLAPLARLARDIHRWKQEIIDGRSRHPRDH
jgi:hypothetical protein